MLKFGRRPNEKAPKTFFGAFSFNSLIPLKFLPFIDGLPSRLAQSPA
jgi:hypothetical protein